ncbi:MAG: RICIN domain-containing protein [Eggerthellaceae bacterium]|jgi:hypothetical protein
MNSIRFALSRTHTASNRTENQYRGFSFTVGIAAIVLICGLYTGSLIAPEAAFAGDSATMTAAAKGVQSSVTGASGSRADMKASPAKVGSKARPLANGSYSLLNRADRTYSLSFQRTSGSAILKRFTATAGQTFTLHYNQTRKAYTIRIARSGKYLAAAAKRGSSHTTQVKHAATQRAFWRLSKSSNGWKLTNLASKRTLKAGSARNGSTVAVGKLVGARSHWSLYAVKSCKKVAKSMRLNRMVDFIIRTKTRATDSNAVKLHKVYYYIASTAFSYAHVNGQKRPKKKGWSETYALNMAIKHRGNCYSLSSLFGYLARACGYQTKIISGDVTSIYGGLAKHGWTMLKVSGGYGNQYPKASKKGHWHVFDPEASASYSGNFFNIKKGGKWPAIYHYTHNELTE